MQRTMLRVEWRYLLTIPLLFGLMSSVGCWIFDAPPEEQAADKTGEGTIEEADIENPEGDTSVSAADGGPGFSGQGWTTAEPRPLGDPEAKKGGVLTGLAQYSWPATLRIHGIQANTFLNSVTENLCYQSLCRIDPNTREVVPSLASHWKISEDKMTFHFRIDPRAHWSDGEPVTAEDVIATYDLISDPTMADPMGKAALVDRIERPVKLSKYIVRVKGKGKFWRNFLTISGLSLLPAHELRRETLKANGRKPKEIVETEAIWTPAVAPRPGKNGSTVYSEQPESTERLAKLVKQSIGLRDLLGEKTPPGKVYIKNYNFKLTATSGPYTVTEADIRDNESISYTRRTKFWGVDDVFNQGVYNFDKLRFRVITNPKLAFEKAVAGELDFYPIYTAQWWVEEINPDKLDTMKRNLLFRQKVFTDFPSGYQGMAFNMRKPPLDDVYVRKAIAHCYDRVTMIDKFAFGEYTPLKSYFPDGPGENPENVMVDYDLRKATELLQQSGWEHRGPDGVLVKDGKRLSLTVMYRSPAFTKYMTTLKNAAQQVGIELKLQLTDPTQHWKTVTEDRNFEIAGMSWGAVLFADPKLSWHSSMANENGSNNIAGLQNDAVDELIAEYDREFDLDKRSLIQQKIDAEIFNQHPYALDWSSGSQRLLYWNKFGMPEYVLPRYTDYRAVYEYWWVDPEKDAMLKKMRKSGGSMPGPRPQGELKPWDKKDGKVAATR